MDGIVNKDYYKSNSPAPTSTAAAAAAVLPSTMNAPSANLTPNGMDITVRTE